MTTPIKILIVEDSRDDTELLLKELVRAGFDPQWTRVETEQDYLTQLKPDVSLVLSDFSLPQFSATRALELLQSSRLELPFIIVSGTIGEERAVEGMKAGATDYVMKDRMIRLGPVVKRALREIQERAERKQLKEQFIEAQKMEIVGQLAGGVAHDFNNILSVIIGYSELMMVEPGNEGSVRECTEEIRQAAERAAGLTRQLLLFSRKQTLQSEVLDLNEVIRGMDKMLRRLIDENVELTMGLAPEIGRIKADSGQLGQVLMNLVVNARDAMPSGGKLKIETGNVTLDQKDLRVKGGAKPGDYVMLTLSDTGTGMSAEVKARLFQPFFTTKPKGKGTGLGLATCQTIVDQCGGFIDVQTETGAGSVFRIYYPRCDGAGATRRASASGAGSLAAARGSETLLIVEDEPALRYLACSVLESQGYSVLSANNGDEGLRIAREHKGAPIRLVITDVIMPRMSGKVMAESLTSMHPGLKILFTSGYHDDAIQQHGVLEPGVAFLPKPYTPAMLATKVREILDGVDVINPDFRQTAVRKR